MTTSARRPGRPLHGELTTIRAARAEDAAMLASWHADPEVARFWDWEIDDHDQIVERLADPSLDAYVVEADGSPAGYLQAWFEDGRCGLDMFLVPAARGRGLGPDAAHTLARY